MNILIDNSSGIPIYQQIYEQIKEAILSQKVAEGEILPSIRQLARELKVSVITTTRAYSDLEKDAFIMIVHGKGCYVKSISREVLEERLLKNMEEHFVEIMKTAHLLNKSNEEVLELFTSFMEDRSYD